MVNGKYREVAIGQTDPVQAGDILRVSLALDESGLASR